MKGWEDGLGRGKEVGRRVEVSWATEREKKRAGLLVGLKRGVSGFLFLFFCKSLETNSI